MDKVIRYYPKVVWNPNSHSDRDEIRLSQSGDDILLPSPPRFGLEFLLPHDFMAQLDRPITLHLYDYEGKSYLRPYDYCTMNLSANEYYQFIRLQMDERAREVRLTIGTTTFQVKWK